MTDAKPTGLYPGWGRVILIEAQCPLLCNMIGASPKESWRESFWDVCDSVEDLEWVRRNWYRELNDSITPKNNIIAVAQLIERQLAHRMRPKLTLVERLQALGQRPITSTI